MFWNLKNLWKTLDLLQLSCVLYCNQYTQRLPMISFTDGLFHRVLTRAIRWSQDCGGHEPHLQYRSAKFYLDSEHDYVLEMAPSRLARIKVIIKLTSRGLFGLIRLKDWWTLSSSLEVLHQLKLIAKEDSQWLSIIFCARDPYTRVWVF